jgi:hypothetical protein
VQGQGRQKQARPAGLAAPVEMDGSGLVSHATEMFAHTVSSGDAARGARDRRPDHPPRGDG